METNQLINMLFNSMDSEYIQENDDKIIDLLKLAAHSIKRLSDDNKKLRNDLIMQTALVQNNKGVIETNKQLTRKFNALFDDFRNVILKSDEVCNYCKHFKPCDGKSCKQYIEGVGAYNHTGHKHDWEWSCMDFNYGECPMLENTPCNGCNFKNNWEWRGE